MIHITKAFYKISRKTSTISKVRLVLTNYKLCINKCILSVTFTPINSQEHQMLSSHNYKFTRYYTNCKLCYCEIYISILCTVSPSLNKPHKNSKNEINNFTAVICPSMNVPGIDMFIYNITDLYITYDRVTYCPIFEQQNINYDFYFDSLVPYLLSLIYILSCLVKLCAIITFIICPFMDVPDLDMFLCNITDLYMNCDRVSNCPIFNQQNITYWFYFDSQVPYILFIIYTLFCLVKLCAIITSPNHILDIMFFISLLCLYTFILKLAVIMYLIIVPAQTIYINTELQYHTNSVLTKEIYIFKCIYFIHCHGIWGNLLITNNVVNHFNLIKKQQSLS